MGHVDVNVYLSGNLPSSQINNFPFIWITDTPSGSPTDYGNIIVMRFDYVQNFELVADKNILPSFFSAPQGSDMNGSFLFDFGGVNRKVNIRAVLKADSASQAEEYMRLLSYVFETQVAGIGACVTVNVPDLGLNFKGVYLGGNFRYNAGETYVIYVSLTFGLGTVIGIGGCSG